MGSSAANWSRAPAASPASPVQRASRSRAARVRVLRAEDPLEHGEQRGAQLLGGGRVPRLPGSAGVLVPGHQGGQVVRARNLLLHGEQRGELVPGGGWVPCLPGPAGELVPGG
jgi:hypothetical protein